MNKEKQIKQVGGKIREHIFSRSGGAPLVKNNYTKCLIDSKENFDAWLEALNNAKKFICIEMYIFTNDDFGRTFRDILVKKLAEGVQVYLVYDWIGSLPALMRGYFKPIIKAGGKVHAYNKFNLVLGLGNLSRNHRKSIVVDGEIAFVSGLCVSAQWNGDPEKNIPPWRDTGLLLKGSIVQQVLLAFVDTWKSLGQKIEDDILLEQADTIQGNESARVVATTPKNANMVRLDLSAISMARKMLWMTDAYFMPSHMYTQALINAALDGVDVRILVPRTSDIKWIAMVSRTQYRGLLEAGVRVFEWNGSMIHAKTSMVDGSYARIGSTNLNFSSWFANRELDILLENKESVKPLAEQFEKDLENTTEIILNKNNELDLKTERESLSIKDHLNTPQMHAKDFLRQIANAGKALKLMPDERTDVVDKPEMFAYASIALFFSLLAVLVYFFPLIATLPIIIILLSGALIAFARAIKAWEKVESRDLSE